MRPALINPRIARMIRQDKQVAVASVVALWLIYGFMFWKLTGIVGPSALGFLTASGIAGFSIVILNTISIFVMIWRGSSDTEIARIYGPEINCDQVEDCAPPDTWLAGQ